MLNFLYTAVSWVLLRWHQLLGAIGMDANSGLTWALSIVLLVITARLLLFRMFVKQVHYQRNMQRLQPQIKKLREKYKDDRAEMNRQMMKLQQEEGFNPVAGCLPMFLQVPVFIGLYHTLRHVANWVNLCDRPYAGLSTASKALLNKYTFSNGETCSAAKAHLFGAPLAASFRDGSHTIHQLGGDVGSTRAVLLVLLLVSAVATFSTQLLVRANQAVAPEGSAATIQRLMLWVIPAGSLFFGLVFKFPLGVVLYWFATNLWTLGQQAYIIRFHPPDAPAAAAVVGELGKTLAPKVGQRPVRMSKPKPEGPPAAGRAGTVGTAGVGNKAPGNRANKPRVERVEPEDATSKSGTARSVPPPGARPNRPNGKRPPAKRPTQAKKRR